jgi:eukaryotic-like serine/threonine-protein kinase
MSEDITTQFVLQSDVVLTPVQELPMTAREQLGADEGDYALSRTMSRAPVRVLDRDSADLLQRFRSPTRIVDAILSYSRDHRIGAEATLEEAFPILQRLIDSQVLVVATSDATTSAQSGLKVGDLFEGARVLATVQVLDDTEVHLVRTGDGGHAALKLFNAPEGASSMRHMQQEEAILRHLDGRVAPRVLAAGNRAGAAYLLLEWRPGVSAEAAAAEARRSGGESRQALLEICCSIADAYARLHAAGVVHGDVHPRNILVAADGTVTIIDFGYAVMPASGEPRTARASRGGIAFFLEPEYALAQRAGQPAPPATMLGEQYAVAALLYLLFTGSHYLDFSLEPDQLLRQIAEEQPLPFAERNTPPWPQLEELLLKCLSKRSEDRLLDMSAVAERLGAMRDAIPVPTGGPRNDVAPARRLLDEVLGRVGFEGPLVSQGLPQAPTSSLNYGAAGIAYALYRLAGVRDDPVLLALADVWVTRARAHMDDDDGCFSAELDITPETVGRSSTFHSGAGVEAVSAIVAQARGDVMARKAAVSAFLERSHLPLLSLDLTLGRCSSLLGCCLLLETLVTADAGEREEIRRFGDRRAQEIRTEIVAFPPIGNRGEIAYMGVAHGWAGILYALLLWDEVTGRAPAPEVVMRLDELALSAQPWGRGVRWPIRTGGASSYMGGWCNGSAGFVHLFTLAWRTSRNDRWLRLAEQAAWTTWEADDPVSSLCCGRSGRAYALLNLYRHTDETAWHERARDLALRAAAHAADGVEQGRVDSLYKGLLGVSLLAAEIEVPTQARMPFFEPEGWPKPETLPSIASS